MTLTEQELSNKTKAARKRNTAQAWRDLAKELIRSGYSKYSPIVQECYDNADICELAKLETKPRS